MSGLMVLFLATIAHATYSPFMDSIMNRFEFVSLFVSSVTFFCGVFTVDAGASGSSYGGASVVAMLLNLFYMVYACYVLRRVVAEQKQEEARSKESLSAGLSALNAGNDHGSDALKSSPARSGSPRGGTTASAASSPELELVSVVGLEPAGPVRPASDETEATPLDDRTPAGLDSSVSTGLSSGIENKSQDRKELRMVKSISAFKARKPTQMSFDKGAIIEVNYIYKHSLSYHLNTFTSVLGFVWDTYLY